MADSTITLRVVGDTAKAGNAPAAPTQVPGNAPATAPQAPGAPTAPTAAPATAPSTAQNAPANGGKSLAGQIGAMAGGLFLQQGVSALANGLSGFRPDMQKEANWLGNVGGGALGGAAARDGWASLFSDINEAALKAVRSLLGLSDATTQSADKIQREIDKIEQVRLSQAIRVSVRRQDEAFKKSLAPMTQDQRLNAIGGRMAQLAHGNGESSVDNLETRLKIMASKGESESAEYKATFALYKTQLGRLGRLSSLYDRTEATPPLSLLRPGEVTDSLAKRGGTVGPSVDVADVNRDLLATLRDFFQAWRTRAANRPDTVRGIESTSGFATTAILK